MATGYSLEYQPARWEKDGAQVAGGNGKIQKKWVFFSLCYAFILHEFWFSSSGFVKDRKTRGISLYKSTHHTLVWLWFYFIFNSRWQDETSDTSVMIEAEASCTGHDGPDIVVVYVPAQA